MRKFRALLSLFLVILFCGCGTGQEQEDNFSTKIPNSSTPTTVSATESANRPTETPTPIPTEAPVELVVYSQLSSFWGEQQGWFANILLDKFNVKLYIQPDIYDEDNEEKKADILVFGSTGEKYQKLAKQGVLLDWEANGLLEQHGFYIKEHMSKALEHNRSLTPELGKVFGFGNNVASSVERAEEFFYTWDIRWDLYRQSGYPEVKNLEDLVCVLEDMKAICPLDEKGEEVYAFSLWPDWDNGMVMYVKAMASAYYGLDEMGLGLYDTNTGTFYGALKEQGPYLELLRFFNTLYRKGLLDPDSATQTYEDMIAKLQQGGVLCSIFNYAGSLSYNTEEHLEKNQYMASLLPQEAVPVTYGQSVFGGNKVWTIRADTTYPELCMEIINWLCTPEGKMVSSYGPQGIIWDYDESGNTYFTEFGRLCYFEDGSTMMTGDYAGYSYWDGFPQINNTTWSMNAENPDSNGETYNQYDWKSNMPEVSCEAEQDWRNFTGALTLDDYLKTKQYVVIPATAYKASEKSKELELMWNRVADCIVKGSWDAIYADSEKAFDAIVSGMCSQAKAYGYEKCVEWCETEAAVRFELEEQVRK